MRVAKFHPRSLIRLSAQSATSAVMVAESGKSALEISKLAHGIMRQALLGSLVSFQGGPNLFNPSSFCPFSPLAH